MSLSRIFCLILMLILSSQERELIAQDSILLRPIDISTKVNSPTTIANFALKSRPDSSYSSSSDVSHILSQWGIQTKINAPGGLGTISIRGMSASHTSQFWNGLALNSPLNGTVDLNQEYMNPAFISMTLLKSNSPQWQGYSGPGGSLWLQQFMPDDSWGGGITMKIGSFGYLMATMATSVKIGSTKHLISVLYNRADNDYPYKPVISGQNEYPKLSGAAYNHIGINYTASLLSGLQLHVLLQEHNSDIPLPVSSSGMGASQFNREWRLSLQYEKLWRQWTFGAASGLVNNHIQYEAVKGLGNPLIYDTYNIPLGNIYLNRSIGSFSLQAGVSSVQTFVKSTEIKAKSENDTRITTSIDKTTAPWIYGGKLQFQINGRYTPLVYNLYAGRKFSNSVVSLSYSISERIPTINDRYWPLSGNPNLLTEKCNSVELNYKGGIIKTGFSYQIAAFYNVTDNWILWKPTSSTGLWSPYNIQSVRNKGFDSHVKYSIYRSSAHHFFSADINYCNPVVSKDYAGNLQSIGKILSYVSSWQTALCYELTWRLWNVSVDYRYFSGRYTTSDNAPTYRLPADYFGDILLARSIPIFGDNLRFGLEVKNIFNRLSYSLPYRPLPGRQIYATVGWEIRRK
ncbi:MAG TPA: hypothetical protein PLP06_01110 [Saprospiraceae bacterium]|nr:hypothetical protein [Saprospiraceae bacterium]